MESLQITALFERECVIHSSHICHFNKNERISRVFSLSSCQQKNNQQTNQQKISSGNNNSISLRPHAHNLVCEWESECDNLFWKQTETVVQANTNKIITRLTEISGLVYDTRNCEFFFVFVILASAVVHRAHTHSMSMWRKKKKVCSSNGDKLSSNQSSSFDGSWPWFVICEMCCIHGQD